MEVGAVKQAFNNEVILLKKKLNQAKIQIIHKLTRKAKTFTEKKVPEKLKGKFTKKAESAVKEVLIIKKIKARDVARFIVTHKGQLNEYLNRPAVDKDKACARLLLHKALKDKYKILRDRFSNISIDDLLMSRQERLKRKKEAREKQKNKKKGKEDNALVQAEGHWDVEDIDMASIKVRNESDEDSESNYEHDEIDDSVNENVSENDDSSYNGDGEIGKNNIENRHKSNDRDVNNFKAVYNESNDEEQSDNESSDSNIDDESGVGKFVRLSASLPDSETVSKNKTKIEKEVKLNKIVNNEPNNEDKIEEQVKVQKEVKLNKKIINNKAIKKNKEGHKNKNLNNKILMKKFNTNKLEKPAQENKVVDPFFITATGENYMSVAEPRQPDEVKEVHKQGNRKYRRAVMFGHAPKAKPRRDNFTNDKRNSRFSKFDDGNIKGNFNSGFKPNGFDKANQHQRFNRDDASETDFKDRRRDDKKNIEDTYKSEKLHPSWEAKKRQSGILPFQGKKIVFDES